MSIEEIPEHSWFLLKEDIHDFLSPLYLNLKWYEGEREQEIFRDAKNGFIIVNVWERFLFSLFNQQKQIQGISKDFFKILISTFNIESENKLSERQKQHQTSKEIYAHLIGKYLMFLFES